MKNRKINLFFKSDKREAEREIKITQIQLFHLFWNLCIILMI